MKSLRTPLIDGNTPQRLFCYGTLQLPAVLKAVIGRPLQGVRATRTHIVLDTIKETRQIA